MMLKHFTPLRRFSTSKVLARPTLSSSYKSHKLWEERFNCGILAANEESVKAINTKIMSLTKLNNLELDIFINIAAPRTDDIDQLQEAAKLVKDFRRSLYAHMILPSTQSALCRLFIDSRRLPNLLNILEDRVNYGIFPDFFSTNLMFDDLLEESQYNLASRLANSVLLQEEFGINQITDRFSLYSVAKYIESKTDFQDWDPLPRTSDPILNEDRSSENIDSTPKDSQRKEEDEDDEEGEEDDVEYIRVPFLKNPYFDDHFDVTNPRTICGRILSFASMSLEDKELTLKCQLLGDILQGKWLEATKKSEISVQSGLDMGPVKELCKHYIENLHGLEAPSDEIKSSLMSSINLLKDGGATISDRVDSLSKSLDEMEKKDIEHLKSEFLRWSKLRVKTLKALEDHEAKTKLIAEIKAKKEELRLKEQYLYFFDNLKKSTATRVEYN